MAAAQRENEASEAGSKTTASASPAGDSSTQDESTRSTAASRLAARRAAKAAAKASKRGTGPVVPDGFVQTVGSATSMLQESSRMVWAVVAAVALFVIVAIAFNGHVKKRDREATDLLTTGLTVAQARIVASTEDGEDEGEGANDEDETFPTRSDRAQRMRAAFGEVNKKFPGSEAATWALLGDANALYELGKYPEAERAYARLAGAKADAYVTFRALEGTAFSLEGQGKHEEAQQALQRLATHEDGAYKLIADHHRARMLIARGQKREAATALEALLKAERERPENKPQRFPSVLSDAENLLAELSVDLDDPKLRAELPATRAGGSESSGGINQGLLDALRLQLESGGGHGLSKETLEALQHSTGGGANNPITIPITPHAPSAPSAPGEEGAPAPAPPAAEATPSAP